MILMNTLYYIRTYEYILNWIKNNRGNWIWIKRNIYTLISKIYNNISNLTKYLRYIIQFILHASSIKTTVFRMFNLHRIALCLIQSNKRIQSKVLCLNIKQAVCDNVIPCYRNLFFTNIFTEVAQYRWRTKTVVISGQDRSRATLVKRRCLLMISIIPRTSSVAGSKEPISSKVGVYFNY